MIYLRNIFLSCTLFYSLNSIAQNAQLTKLWETDSTLKVPESVLYSPEDKILYVSSIDGKSNEKDLKGSISKISLDGKQIDNWAINLSAPKGMGIHKENLYVADLDEVVVIDIKSGKPVQRIPIAAAIFLNDLAIDQAGVIYVSDSRTGKIHRIQDSAVTTFLENQIGVNGLLTSDDNLYFAAKGTLWKADKNKTLTKITDGMDESTDGIIQTNKNDFLVSCWNGIIYQVKSDGSKHTLLDTRSQKSNTADIGYDPDKNILYVPTFLKNRVVAYQVK